METENSIENQYQTNWKIPIGIIILIIFWVALCWMFIPIKNFTMNIIANILVFLARMAYPMM